MAPIQNDPPAAPVRATDPSDRRAAAVDGRTAGPRKTDPGAVATSAMIAVIALLIGFFAIQFFYATQLHVRISEMQLNGVPINIWRTESIRDKIANWQKRLAGIEEKLVGLREVQDGAMRLATLADTQAATAESDLKEKIVSSAGLTGLSDVPEDEVGLAYYRLTAALREKIAAETNNESWRTLLDELQAAYRNFTAKRAEAQTNKDRMILAKAEVSNADEIKKGIEAESRRMFGLSSSDVAPDLVERVSNIVTEIEPVSESVVAFLPGRALIFWPTENLVLSLVITMGVLGSCLHLLAERFGSSASEGTAMRVSFGQALLRLFYGGVMALVVYLVAKASVPILTDTSRIGGQAPLNPYFISFVGIISGLASERAIQSLRGVGEGIFPSGDGLAVRPRYATPMLADALEKQGLRTEELGAYLKLPPGETADAVAGRRTLTPNEQAIIAAFLRADAREIFSDLRSEHPGGAAPKEPPPPG
jgi:hypothetical protein